MHPSCMGVPMFSEGRQFGIGWLVTVGPHSPSYSSLRSVLPTHPARCENEAPEAGQAPERELAERTSRNTSDGARLRTALSL